MKKEALDRLLSVIISFVIVLSVYQCFQDDTAKADPETDGVTLSVIDINGSAAERTDEESDNPFNRQDDMEVPYDRKRWVQPREWNAPAVDPKEYKGGIMLYFDKIVLEPEYARGNVQRVYFSITGATEPVSRIKFHFFYDTRLTVMENSKGEVITAGKGFQGFTTGSAMIREGELAFYAYSDNTLLSDSCIFTVDFVVPEDAEEGEVYPFGLSYVVDDVAADTFINSEQDDAGRLQMTYVFTKGIYNGYIKIKGEKKTTPAVTPVRPVSPDEYNTGDVNNDGFINAADSSSVLSYYAMISTDQDGGYTEEQKLAADVNKDGLTDAVDASGILSYYAYVSTTEEDIMPIEEYMENF